MPQPDQFRPMSAPWYEKISPPMNFERLLLLWSFPILKIDAAYKKRGINLGSVGRDKSLAYALENPRKNFSISKTRFGIMLKIHICSKMTKIEFPDDCVINYLSPPLYTHAKLKKPFKLV